VLPHAFEKHFRLKPFADQSAAVVGESNHHGTNLVTLHQISKIFDRQHSRRLVSGFAQRITGHHGNYARRSTKDVLPLRGETAGRLDPVGAFRETVSFNSLR